jgi:PadR family transcriptional regulator, regulatory protein PadR
MNEDNVKAQMRKGILEYCILLLLEKKDAYASDIITQLKENQLIVVEGTLYPLLTRQKNAGLLGYRWEESTQGPPRKYYTITEIGKASLKEMDKSWTELVDTINALKNNQ